MRSQDLTQYFWARFIRIVPALAVVLLTTVLILGPLVSVLSPAEYLTRLDTWSYLLNINLLSLHTQFDLPGVFHNTPYPFSVNGSLWTLPIEVWMYVIIAALFCLGLILRQACPNHSAQLLPVAILGFAVLVCLTSAYYKAHPKADSESMVLFSCVFITGSLMYRYRGIILLRWSIAFILIVGAFWLKNTAIYPVYYAITIAYGVLVLAYLPKGFLLTFNKLGDYSYGLYIYAFPVQQTIVFYNPNVSFGVMLISATLISLMLAIGSWHVIEAPLLKTKYNVRFRSSNRGTLDKK